MKAASINQLDTVEEGESCLEFQSRIKINLKLKSNDQFKRILSSNLYTSAAVAALALNGGMYESCSSTPSVISTTY